MTEPVRPRLDRSRRSLCHAALASVLTLTLPLSSVRAAPAPDEATPASEPAPDAPSSAAREAVPPPEGPMGAGAAEIRAALADGDLTTAKELALALVEAQPSASSYLLEAEVWLALGDYEQTKLALAKARDALPEDDEGRAEIQSRLDEVEARSRGTVADEPASTHREDLDAARAARLAALAPKPPAPEVVDEPEPKVSIAKKWYFWVTLGAIVASAGAIAGIAISTATEDKDGSASTRQPTPIPVGGVMFRF